MTRGIPQPGAADEAAWLADLRRRSPLPLGFGTAGLLQGRSSTQAQAALFAALDAGLRLFDTARMYGHGRTEAVLGQALQGLRDEVVLIGKVGILPPSLLRRGAAKVRRGLGRPAAEAAPRFHVFDASAMRASVEASLRALRTDRLDILLLHECAPEDVTDEVLAFLADLAAEGKIGARGIATSPQAAQALLHAQPAACDVVQVAAFADTPLAPRPPLLITHSPLRPHLRPGASIERERAARALLRRALAENPGGYVLFSACSPARIEANVALARYRERLSDAATTN